MPDRIDLAGMAVWLAAACVLVYYFASLLHAIDLRNLSSLGP